MFIMVGQSATEDVGCKMWSSPGLQDVRMSIYATAISHVRVQLFKDLSLSDDEILAAARMHA
jgi:serine/threonine protein kinase HipA of HipAB toxin-antitoxin module